MGSVQTAARLLPDCFETAATDCLLESRTAVRLFLDRLSELFTDRKVY